MFEFLIGDIVNINEDYIVLQNNGVGYKVFTSSNSIMKTEVGKRDQMLYTQLHVREDGLFLFGFTTEEEMEMFRLLLLVSKIGPKVGIGILSSLTPVQIKIAIINKDIEALCKAPGVGKKTAERIILELKDRIDTNISKDVESIDVVSNNTYNEAIEALMTLGYTKFEIEKSMRTIEIDNMDIEDIIRVVLNKLSKH